MNRDPLFTGELTAARVSGMEEEAKCFLRRFVEEFPAALEEEGPLPASPQSRKVSLEELHGESLELGLRLLTARYDWEGKVHKMHFTCLVGLRDRAKPQQRKSKYTHSETESRRISQSQHESSNCFSP